MKAAAFDFVRVKSLTEACDRLVDHAGAARLVAGGQSLLPAMNLRLISPEILIDIGGIAELRSISVEDHVLRIGCMTRHADLLCSPDIALHAPLLAEAIKEVAHPAIRNRGTIGGNLAHADPASELPACMLALEATIVAFGKQGERRIAAEDFFTGWYETALAEGEILSAVEIPLLAADQSCGFAEFARRSGDYAIAGLAARVSYEGNKIRAPRLAFFAVGDRPILAAHAAAALEAASPPYDEAALASVRAALAEDLSPQDDLQAAAGTRLYLAGILLGRVVAQMGDPRPLPRPVRASTS